MAQNKTASAGASSIPERLTALFRKIDWVAAVCIICVTVMLATLSVLRYRAYDIRMFDLGNMSQAIWSSTQGRPLEFSYRGAPLSRLALHAELIYFLLTPLYALFPSPITLLLFQAMLFGAGSIPLYRLAYRRMGNRNAARLLTLIYLFYPTAQTAVLFDFHGDTLAMPLLLFVFEALDRKDWRAYGVWLVLALSCKMYIAAPVCALGGFLWLKGSRRVGALTCALGLLWGALVFFGIRPLFAAPDVAVQQSSALGYAQFYFGEFFTQLSTTWLPRLAHGVAVFAPIIPVMLYAPYWMGLAFVVAAPVLLSSGPGPSFHYGSHHYALVTPFLMWAILAAATKLNNTRPETTSHKRPVTWPVALGATLGMTLLVNSQLVNTPLSPRFWSQTTEGGRIHRVYHRTARDAFKDRWLAAHVPDEAALLASPLLAPHLAHRYELHVAWPSDGPPVSLEYLLDQVDHVVLDGLLDYLEQNEQGDLIGEVTYDWEVLIAALNRPDYGLLAAQDGLLLLRKQGVGISDVDWEKLTLAQSVTVAPAHSAMPLQVEFANAVGLVEGSVTHVQGRRYRFQYVWLALEGISHSPSLFAVTQLGGAEHARILHIPTLAMAPTKYWQAGDLITEVFEVELADDILPGLYTVTVGWYDSTYTFAYATDGRSQVGNNVQVGTLELSDTRD